MKKLTIIAVLLGAGLFWTLRPGAAQTKSSVAHYEYGVVKWDGPDRLFYNLADHFSWEHLGKVGVKIPGDAQEEEWCLAYAANKLAQDGWEPINLDSRRLLVRRPKLGN